MENTINRTVEPSAPEPRTPPPAYSDIPPPYITAQPLPAIYHEPHVTRIPYATTRPSGTTVHIVSARPPTLGPRPTYLVCPNCRLTVTTKITREYTCATHVTAILLCLVGCWFCACCVYACTNSVHQCPHCNYHMDNGRS